MQAGQDFIYVSSNVALEEMVCSKMITFKDRMEELLLRPLENEGDIRAYKRDLDQLNSDMQALSNSLPEGTRSDTNLGHLRSPLCFEKGIGSAAA